MRRLILLALLGCQPSPSIESAAPLNVLVIVADDQRLDTVLGAGSESCATPNLDSLAAQGTSFSRAVCMGSFSGAVCAPSRAMLLSGKGLPEFVQKPFNPAYDGPLLPEVLREAGYATFGTGKWHSGPSWFHRSFTHGDKIFFGGMGPHTGLAVRPFDPSGNYPKEQMYKEPTFSSEAFADATIEFLQSRPKDQPFFAWLSFTAPHDPRTPPEGWSPSIDEISLPPNFLPEHPFDNGELIIRDEQLAKTPRDPEVVKQHLADYYGIVSHMDAQIGRVLGALEETGGSENTLVVFLADHGLGVGSHGLLGKQNLYEHSMGAPLIFKGPGISQGKITDALTYLHDLAPTVFDFTGVQKPTLLDPYDGKSVRPVLMGTQTEHRPQLFTAYRREQRAVAENRFKLIEYGKARTTQLFDLEADPHEMRNLAKEDGHAATIARLRESLAQHEDQADMPKLARRPNIVLIYSDDHASAAVSSYSEELIQTPHLDRLAHEGLRFTSAFCTNALCGPARAVVLTGQHSHINGFLDNRSSFDATRNTFPKILQKNGYETAVIGKWHLKSEPVGFDFWEILPGQGHYYGPEFRTAEGVVTREGYNSDIVVDRALDWLENDQDPTKPFMLMCQFKAPHRAWLPGPQEVSLFDDRNMPEPPTLFSDYAGLGHAAKRQKMSISSDMGWHYDLKVPPLPGVEPTGLDKWSATRENRMTPAEIAAWNAAYDPRNEAFRNSGLLEDTEAGKEGAQRALTQWKYQRYIKDYLRCIQGIDRNVGRLLDKLEDMEIAEETVVVYSSDQGFFLGENGWYDKRFMYEPSMKIPLLVRWPGVTGAGVRRGELVQNLDFAPTFLDIAGVNIPDWMQGESLVPILKGHGMPGWRDSIYYCYYGEPTHNVAAHYGVRTQTHKLLFFPTLQEWELFDLKKDPLEQHSVFGEDSYHDIQKELMAELESLRQQYQAPEVENFGNAGVEPSQ